MEMRAFYTLPQKDNRYSAIGNLEIIISYVNGSINPVSFDFEYVQQNDPENIKGYGKELTQQIKELLQERINLYRKWIENGKKIGLKGQDVFRFAEHNSWVPMPGQRRY